MCSKITYGPYSPIRRVGNTYYVSGQVGVDPESKETPTNVKEQTAQVLENLKSVLSEHELDMVHVAKTTIFLTDMGNFKDVNEVYATFFKTQPPARSCIAVAELPRVGNNKLLIEIEAVAYKESSNERS